LRIGYHLGNLDGDLFLTPQSSFQSGVADEVLDHYIALLTRAPRVNPPPNLPPFISSNGLIIDRGFVTADERAALLAYLGKL
jgi:hypothetical protein